MTQRLLYADSSALAKLVVEEDESAALERELADEPTLVTSTVALVEVRRAVRIRTLGDPEADGEALRLLRSCRLLAPGAEVVEQAAWIASADVRTLDAIHLASALRAGVPAMLVYDRRLADAARAAGIEPLAPGRV